MHQVGCVHGVMPNCVRNTAVAQHVTVTVVYLFVHMLWMRMWMWICGWICVFEKRETHILI